jgi:hypothetical protein
MVGYFLPPDLRLAALGAVITGADLLLKRK